MIEKLKQFSRQLKKEIAALYLSIRHPEMPWYARVLAVLVVGYAISPIDFIPDFIPVLGYLDDLILLPLGIWLTLKLIPENIMEQCREDAENLFKGKKLKSMTAGFVIVTVWLLILVWGTLKFMDFINA